ncbi:major facilitator superfamily domain-containing protein [Obelidium mucronatum]|nr:major facilitator superfamily domain-containing protein [Obelidium mucronatum]
MARPLFQPHPFHALLVVFLYLFGAMIGIMPFAQLLLLIVCRDLSSSGGAPTVLTRTNLLDLDYASCAKRSEVQAIVSSWTLWFNLAEDIPATLMLICAGYIIDLLGRRKAMIMASFSMLLQSAAFLSSSLFEVPFAMLLPVYVLSGATGGMSVIMLSAMAYISDTSEALERTKYFIFQESVLSIAMSTGPLIGGLITRQFGFPATFLVMFCAASITLLHLLFLFPESENSLLASSSNARVPTTNDTSHKKTLTSVFSESLLTTARTLKSIFGIRTAAALVAVATIQGFAMTSGSILFLLYPAKQFGFDSMKMGTTHSSNFSIHKVTSEVGLLRFGIFMAAFAQLCYGASRTEAEFFASTLPSSLSAFASPTIRSLLSTLVPPSFQGRLFSSVAIFERVVALAGTFFGNVVYRSTVDVWPQALYFVVSGLLGIGFLVTVTLVTKIGVESDGDGTFEATEESPLLA